MKVHFSIAVHSGPDVAYWTNTMLGAEVPRVGDYVQVGVVEAEVKRVKWCYKQSLVVVLLGRVPRGGDHMDEQMLAEGWVKE